MPVMLVGRVLFFFGVRSQVNKQMRGGCDVQFVWRLFSSLKAAFLKVTPVAVHLWLILAQGLMIQDWRKTCRSGDCFVTYFVDIRYTTSQKVKEFVSKRGFPFPSFSQECEQSCDIDQQNISATSVKP